MKVGDGIRALNGRWTFSGVSEKFDEHVRRSVPLYQEGHDLIAALSDAFLPQQGATCYDLGCSTGRLLAQLAARNEGKALRLIGIDADAGMVQKAQENCRAFRNVEIAARDLLEVELEPADVVIAYYTLQFVLPRHRQAIFDRIYGALNWGGAFFLFEKVRGPDARFQDLLTGVYTEFKIEQGYDAAEIVGKARSLKGVLEPFSTEGNLGLLGRAGFVDVMTIFKYACFEGFLAIK